MDQKGIINSDWNNVVSDVRNDAVFDNRNKEYGAYWIRKNYNRVVLLAFYIAAGGFVIALNITSYISLD